MFRHLLKLIWNRKRSNILLVLEIFAAFLVVFSVCGTGLYLFELYNRPMGFDPTDVWGIGITRGSAEIRDSWTEENSVTMRSIVDELRSLPEVLSVSYGTNRPYSTSTSVTRWEYEGREVEAEIQRASVETLDVLKLELIAGRWFEPQDQFLDWEPVVITPALARDLFGDEDPIGRRMTDEDDEDDRRVVGLLRGYRLHGELYEPRPFFFRRAWLEGYDAFPLEDMLLRVAPGTTADLEQQLADRLHAVAPTWSFEITTLERASEEHVSETVLPKLLSALIAGFLLLMVVLGLTGVMWQNVTRRIREIGIRRAVGAGRGDIHRQVVVEVMIIAGFGVALGSLVAIQVPLIPDLSFFSFPVVLAALGLSAAFMLLLAAGCGLYPGWTATRIHPAEALHYE
jgi:putative ABC transport system permease protein